MSEYNPYPTRHLYPLTARAPAEQGDTSDMPTRCADQPTCWKSTSRCDMAELGRPGETQPCHLVSSYCDMRTNTCRATRVPWPGKNNCVDWTTMRSRSPCSTPEPIEPEDTDERQEAPPPGPINPGVLRF